MKHVKNIVIICWIVVILEFIISFSLALYRYQLNPDNNDIAIYTEFIRSFPNLYGNRLVVYLPYFYFIFYPFALIPNFIAFICFSVLNFICLNLTILRSKVIGQSFHYSVIGYFMLVSWYLGFWANLETIILYLYVELYIWVEKIHKTNELVLNAVLFSLISFKIYSFLFIIPFIYSGIKESHFRRVYCSVILCSQLVFNAYFIVLFFEQISFSYMTSFMLKNPLTDPTKVSVIVELILRPNFIVPLIMISIYVKDAYYEVAIDCLCKSSLCM